MLDKFPLFNDLKWYMSCIEHEYECWFPDRAFQENNEMLLHFYDDKMIPVEMVDILTRYNRFIYNLHK